MVAANGTSQPQITKWFYKAADLEIYGPYEGTSMIQWVHSGFFKEGLLIKTGNEETFHTLGDWQRICGGKVPFMFNNIVSFDHTLFVLTTQPNQAMNPGQPMHMFPPGLAPPQHLAGHVRHPTSLSQFMMSPDFPLSQPPSEPNETSVPSPECEAMRPPAKRTIGTDPMPTTSQEIGVQTIPCLVSADHAARLLSEIFGQQVEIR